jgi:hypothetical protein
VEVTVRLSRRKESHWVVLKGWRLSSQNVTADRARHTAGDLGHRSRREPQARGRCPLGRLPSAVLT